MCPTKTQISLRICTVWSESSFCMMKLCNLGYLNMPCEDSDQTAQMRSLIWIFAGHTSEGMTTLLICILCLFAFAGINVWNIV